MLQSKFVFNLSVINTFSSVKFRYEIKNKNECEIHYL